MNEEKQSMNKEKESSNSQYLKDKFRGSLWGAVLGDVIGAFLQFSRGIDQKKIQEAFMIKGGGMHKLEAGQPTDDSQLAYAVGRGLLKGKGILDLNKIATEMGNWFLSKPIDVGGTIRKSVPKACNMKEHQAYLVRKGAFQCSKTSESNGTLMAITPLSLWCVNLSPSDIFTAIRQYTILIHPNEMVIFSNVFYTMVLVKVIKSETKTQQNDKKKSILLQIFIQAKQQFISIAKKTNCSGKSIQQFQKWLIFIQQGLKDEVLLLKQLDATKKAGWCRIALTYSMIVLLKGQKYRESLKYILGLKGDTDTNGCIAGGLIGANLGATSIQKQMGKQMQIIQKWKPKNVKRPQWMVPGLVVQNLAQKILQIAPQQLKIIGSQSQYLKK